MKILKSSEVCEDGWYFVKIDDKWIKKEPYYISYSSDGQLIASITNEKGSWGYQLLIDNEDKIEWFGPFNPPNK